MGNHQPSRRQGTPTPGGQQGGQRQPPQAGGAPSAPPGPGLPAWRYYLLFFLILVGSAGYWALFSPGQEVETIAWSEFKRRVRADEVASVTLQGDEATGRFVAAEDGGAADGAREGAGQVTEEGAGEAAQGPRFRTTLPPVEDPGLIPLLEQHGVEISAEPEETNWWAQILVGLLPWILILGLFWWGLSRMQRRMGGEGGPGGIFGFAKSKAKRFQRSESSIDFEDVAGLENAKRDLREITGYLRDPEHFRRLGAKTPRGILLMGPPGTGKTLLAKAMAGEADVPFFSISGSEFIEMFVGVGASRVRDMFESAKAEAPSIIFIDEIDSIGRARGTGVGGGHDEREQTLNQILGEMDGFEPHEAVVVLAATNRPDVLDRALLRPGRFDRKVTLDLPDRRARRSILDIHTRRTALGDDVDLDRIAALTPGFSGADLENLVNEAALLAGREGRTDVDMASLLKARDKVVLGARREMVVEDEEKRLIAFHESGHAMTARLLPHADPLDKVTIIPRGHALGATQQIPGEERHNLRESYLRDRIGVMLGGRAAERVVFGELSSGAEQDLKQATQLARHMVTHWGMSEKLGPVAFRRGEEHVFLGREMAQQRDFSERTAQIIDEEISRVIREIEEKVVNLLGEHRRQLESLAARLLEKETLEAAEIAAIIDGDGVGGGDGEEAREENDDDARTTPAEKPHGVSTECS